MTSVLCECKFNPKVGNDKDTYGFDCGVGGLVREEGIRRETKLGNVPKSDCPRCSVGDGCL